MQNYYTCVPTFITTRLDLNDAEKIFLTILYGLMSKYGFCWASNKYLARVTNKTPRQIPRYLAKLKSLNMVIVEIENKFERKIWLPETWARREELVKVFEHDQKCNLEFNQRFDRYDNGDNGGMTLVPSKEDKNNIYKKEVGIGIYADAVEVVEKPRRLFSHEKEQKKEQAHWPPDLPTQEEVKLVDLMGAEMYKKYKKNALNHLKNSVPGSKNHRISLSELIRKFWSEDMEKDKARDERKKSGITEKAQKSKAWFEKVQKANPHTKADFLCFERGAELLGSSVTSIYVEFSDPKFYSSVEERLNKIEKATKTPYVLPKREDEV